MTDLAKRMREAADILEEWSARQGYGYPVDIEWNAKTLRTEAEHVEAEADAVETIARDLYTTATEAQVRSWDEAENWLADSYRRQAARLIEMGYGK